MTIHNLKVSGEPIAVSANGGVNFYVGNHEGADGRFSFPAGFPSFIGQMQAASLQMARSESGQDLNWRQTSDFWFKKGWRDLAGDPGRALGLALHKVRLLVSWREMENNFVVRWVREKSGPGQVADSLAGTAVVAGLAGPGRGGPAAQFPGHGPAAFPRSPSSWFV